MQSKRDCLIAAGALLGAWLLSASPSLAQSCTPKIGHPPLIEQGSLVAAINPTVAPIQYIDETGKLVGLDVDFGDLIAQRLCLKMDFRSTQFASMIPGLKDGRYDMIDTFMYYTPERASQVIMVPYGAATLAIVVPSANKDAITGVESFGGKRFGVQLGSVDEADARKVSDALVAGGKPAVDVHSFPNYADLLQALAAGQLDAAFVGTEQAFYYQDKGQKFFRIAVTGLNPHTEALAFGNQQVAEQVVTVLDAVKADGSFDALFGKYHHCTLPGPYKITTGPIPAPNCPPFRQQ